MRTVWVFAMIAFSTPQSFDIALDEGMRRYWNGEYEATIGVLDTACQMNASPGERIECHKYLAFSHVALGDDESAEHQFVALLETDPGYRLDESLVSPKILQRFESARAHLARSIYEQGKAAYQVEKFDDALKLLERSLQLDEDNELAREYQTLSRERIALFEAKTAAMTPPEPEPVPKPAAALDNRVYRLTSAIQRPVLLERSSPEYPRAARIRREEGSVVLSVVIDKSGAVTRPQIIRSAGKILDDAAVKAVANWRYEPAVMDGFPVSVYGVVELSFQLDP